MKPEVLIIYQEGFLRKSLSCKLQREGYRVFEVENGDEAEEIARRRDIDVVLLDSGHLKREAFGFLQQIRRVRPAAEIILLNSGEDIHLSIEGMKWGAFDDIFPPFDLAIITRRVQAAWEHKAQRTEVTEKRYPRQQVMNRFAATVGLDHVRLWYGQLGEHFMEFEMGHS